MFSVGEKGKRLCNKGNLGPFRLSVKYICCVGFLCCFFFPYDFRIVQEILTNYACSLI